MTELSQITDEQWQRLSQRTIYFGHQSVGNNILEGMREVMAERRQIPLRLASGVPVVAPGTLNEFNVGENERPESKNADFIAATKGPLGPKPVFMLKYCYVDIDVGTDVQHVFARYRETVAVLKANNPDALMVHVTVPLVTDSGFRNLVNEVRGRPTRRMRNAVRTQYNEMLRAAYAGKEPIYDLAAVEATRADGTIAYGTLHGERVYSLAREWATDDGHLNSAGRRRAAEQMLVTLAQLPGP